TVVSFDRACMLVRWRALAAVFSTAALVCLLGAAATTASTSIRECQTSNDESSARPDIADRYSAEHRCTAWMPSRSVSPDVRAATTRLAARRLRSHSQGPAWVS